jgi:dUTP pyrophosphatase
MNVNVERGTPIIPMNKAILGQSTSNEDFENLLNMMGLIGGFDPETFEQEKQAILNSGIGYEDFLSIVGENFADKFGPREMVDVQIQKLTDSAKIPTYAHTTDACADLYADEAVIIEPNETKLISTGIALAIPMGYVVHIYPRSSIGAKTPLRLSNSVGVLDSGYRDEIKTIYTNTGSEPFSIEKGDRIAQMSIDVAPMARFEVVEDVKEIGEDRGGGIGSTGE